MKAEIRQRALELGFDDCRFTTAAPPLTGPHLESWLAAGRHGEMGYLQRNAHKRTDPQQILPNAKSIICLAASYHDASLHISKPGSAEFPARQHPNNTVEIAPGSLSADPQPTTHNPLSPGLIARYARYSDYHDALGEGLKSLTGFVNGVGAANTRSLWYVDTGPLLERDLAQRAGLGFMGKHTNLISRRLGNWIFLAEILTTLELEPDPPETNRCGSCTRCLAACPTQAITGPFQLDARLCISYLTIELKGAIPVELRPAIGDRIYGCDDCLAICPWNRFAREGRLMRERSRGDLTRPDLVELLALDEAGFRRRFAGTPMLRAKRRGLLRNVCVALGNTGKVNALPALNRATSDPEPLIGEHARWAIDQIAQRTRQSSR